MRRTSKIQKGVGGKRTKPVKKPQPIKKPRPATSGEHVAVAAAIAERPSTDKAEEQLDIEDLIGAPETWKLKTVRAENAAQLRGPGRPPGARNKRTLEWAEYLLTRYASPLEVLAQMAVARVDELAASLGCTKLEAFQEKRQAAIALVPYVHQKQPLAVNLNNKTFVYLTINEGDENGPRDDDITLTARVVEKIGDGPKPQP